MVGSSAAMLDPASRAGLLAGKDKLAIASGTGLEIAPAD